MATDSDRCAAASRRDFAWRRSPGDQQAAPPLARLALLWHYKRAEHRIVGHRNSKGKATVIMIDSSFPKKIFVNPSNIEGDTEPISNAPSVEESERIV